MRRRIHLYCYYLQNISCFLRQNLKLLRIRDKKILNADTIHWLLSPQWNIHEIYHMLGTTSPLELKITRSDSVQSQKINYLKLCSYRIIMENCNHMIIFMEGVLLIFSCVLPNPHDVAKVELTPSVLVTSQIGY